MGKLIDRGKFWDNLNDEFEMGVTDAIEAVNNALDNTPTVDAVPVTRCKDCKYRNSSGCPMDNILPWYDTDPDDFCSHGEPVNKLVESVDK